MKTMIALALMASACGGYRGQEEVRYAIDRSYPEWEASQVRLELSCLTTSFGVRFVEVPDNQAELKIASYESPDSKLSGHYTDGSDTININFAIGGMTAGEMRHVVGHEVGHWFGLHHNCGRCDNLMSAQDYREQTGAILAEDIRDFRSLWPSIPPP